MRETLRGCISITSVCKELFKVQYDVTLITQESYLFLLAYENKCEERCHPLHSPNVTKIANTLTRLQATWYSIRQE